MKRLPLITLLLALISVACFAIPIYVIRPFRHQGAMELSFALFVKQVGPWVSIACVILCLAVILFSWNQTHGWLTRSVAILCLLLALGGAYLARVNVYELMFHPLGPPRFESAQQAHVDKDDMVLAVRVNGVSRAYPIREMGYHHVVNDVVGGKPIVATY